MNYVDASSVFFVFMTEIFATMLFTKVLYEIVTTHGRKEKLNPEYTELKKKIDAFLDIVKSEKTAPIILASMEDLQENGVNNYAQRADAYLIYQANQRV